MIEERFIPKCNFQKCKFIVNIKDNENQVVLDINDIVDLLNEQQATISHLEKVNGKNFAKRRLLEQDNLVLKNENEQLRQKLDFYLLDEIEWKEKYGD